MLEGGILNDLQGGFRRGRRTDDNLFMLGQFKDLAEARGREASGRVFGFGESLWSKLMEVLEEAGLHQKWIRVLKEVYKENQVTFVLGELESGRVKCTNGV